MGTSSWIKMDKSSDFYQYFRSVIPSIIFKKKALELNQNVVTNTKHAHAYLIKSGVQDDRK